MRLRRLVRKKGTNSLLNIEKSVQQYKQAVRVIKDAILYSLYWAAKLVTGEQLSLYFGIGGYVSAHSRQEAWGTSVIDRISEQLRSELPGLRGFSSLNIRNMRSFYEYWRQYIICSPMASKLQIAVNKDVIDIDNFSLQKWSPMASEINREEFLGISFSHHMEILHKTKDFHEILFYIQSCKSQNINVADHFREVTKMISLGCDNYGKEI